MVYLTQVYGAPAPQSEPLPGREGEMVQNSAGGMAFPVDDFTRLRRFWYSARRAAATMRQSAS